jgi:CRP-like cAMP-binding protein
VLLGTDRDAAAVAERLRPRVELLSVLDLFSGVDRNTLERLAKEAEERALPARTVLLAEGEEADALWVLVSGSLTARARGKRPTARQLPAVHAPAYVGELGLLHGTPRTATVRAREDCVLLRIDGRDFLETLSSVRASASLMSIAGVLLARTAPAAARRPVPEPAG